MADRGDSGWEYVVISHSHWDREWYVPFQSYRIRLVRLMDAVLEILSSNPDYKHFMTDGQTAPVEDYLAIRPDRRKLVERLVREGRLLIGPWYVAPDEFLPHAESLIRNLQRGIRVARDFGGVMRVGYQPDAFGHSAHLPAILRGFGFESAVVWRGVDERARKTEFRWRSPDGSSVLALYLPLGYGFAWPLPPEPQQVAERVDFFRQSLAPPAATRYLAIMNGNDHAPPQPDLPALLDGANADLRDGRIVQSSLPQLLAEIAAEVEEKRLRLPVYDGEMRSSQRSPLLPGSISARMWVKQRSQRCEEALIAAAEPLSAWCALLRARLVDKWREPSLPWGPITGYPVAWPSVAGLLREAWRQLLMNQQHDPLVRGRCRFDLRRGGASLRRLRADCGRPGAPDAHVPCGAGGRGREAERRRLQPAERPAQRLRHVRLAAGGRRGSATDRRGREGAPARLPDRLGAGW